MVEDSSPGPQTPVVESSRRTRISWRWVALGVVALYGFLLVVLNTQTVHVEFVFWSTDASLVVVLLLALAIGFLGGFLFDTLRDRRRRESSG